MYAGWDARHRTLVGFFSGVQNVDENGTLPATAAAFPKGFKMIPSGAAPPAI